MSNPYDDPGIASTVTSLLRFDSLSQAERVTGQDYQGSDETSFLGLALAIEQSESLNALLTLADDARYGTTPAEYRGILASEGFRSEFSIPFEGHSAQEYLEVWWKESEGLLLRFETYNGRGINSANVYYNWRSSKGPTRWSRLLSSGMVHDGIWSGDHDAREAIRLKLHNLRTNGDFIVPWIAPPRFSLCHYMENREYSFATRDHFDQITRERISFLSKRTRALIGSSSEEDAS